MNILFHIRATFISHANNLISSVYECVSLRSVGASVLEVLPVVSKRDPSIEASTAVSTAVVGDTLYAVTSNKESIDIVNDRRCKYFSLY